MRPSSDTGREDTGAAEAGDGEDEGNDGTASSNGQPPAKRFRTGPNGTFKATAVRLQSCATYARAD